MLPQTYVLVFGGRVAGAVRRVEGGMVKTSVAQAA
jgi:hypothetical protein